MSTTPKWVYKLSETVDEHREQPIYCVSFNDVSKKEKDVFATCGGRRVSVYECRKDGGIEPVQFYADESEAEEFFVVKWAVLQTTGAPLLLAAGRLGVVRVLDCHDQSLLWTAVGHGEAINDLAAHPHQPDLFLSASKDCSLRLWNLRTKTCVLIAMGDECHTNEVLSVDFHPLDKHRFVSGGMDDTVKIWWLKGKQSEIEASLTYDASCGRSFPVAHLAAPIFSTHKVHWNYVDCVRCFGDLILSKSVDNRILLWKPITDATRTATSLSGPRYDLKGRVHLVQEFHLEEADVWFLRFSVDPTFRVMACGSRTGRVFVWDLMASEHASRPRAVLRIKAKEKHTVRQTAVSEDGATILVCCDNACIYRFDALPPEH